MGILNTVKKNLPTIFLHCLFIFQGDTKPRRIPTPILGTGPTGYNIVMVALGAKVFISLFN